MDSEKNAYESILSLIINIIIPSTLLLMSKKFQGIDPLITLITALLFPLCYAIYELVTSKKWSFIALIGFFSILLTGSIALLKLPPQLIAVKESIIPLTIGIVILVTIKSKKPAIIWIVKAILDFEKIEQKINQQNKKVEFKRVLEKSTFLLSISFLISTILNFLLAFLLVKSPAGSIAFNEEIGLMTALSYPVIVIPSMIMMGISVWYLCKKIMLLTEYQFEEIIQDKLK